MKSFPAFEELTAQGRQTLLYDNTNAKDQWRSSVCQALFLFFFLGMRLDYISQTPLQLDGATGLTFD